jgi:predicted CoA-binding protein
MMKTLVIGASEKRDRYSNMAIRELRNHGHEVVAVGMKKGQVEDVFIETEIPSINDIHTISIYLNPERQQDFYNQLLQLKPNRIIFNPGTENATFQQLAKNSGVEVLEACTLVMLRTGQY